MLSPNSQSVSSSGLSSTTAYDVGATEGKPEVFIGIGEDQHASHPSNASKQPPASKIANLFRPSRQIPMAWLCLLTTTALFILTVLYAYRPSILSDVSPVRSSIPHSIRVLRLLSGITDVLLYASCFAALERVQMLPSFRPDGMPAVSFLSLNISTGFMGLLVLVFGKGTKSAMARSFAMIRLLVIVLCPALGIIIISELQPLRAIARKADLRRTGDVTTHLTFHALEPYTAPYGTGMSLLSSKVAVLAAAQADRIFSSMMTSFVTNSEFAVDITRKDLRSMSCANIPVKGQTQTCGREIFMPGIIPEELLLKETSLEVDLAVAYGMKGYVLRFGPGDSTGTWRFDDAECRSYGIATGAVHLCIQNRMPNEIRARESQNASRSVTTY